MIRGVVWGHYSPLPHSNLPPTYLGAECNTEGEGVVTHQL